MLPARRRAHVVASAEPEEAAAAADPAAAESKRAADIFTLEERQDGWDDVRSSIKSGIKDRSKAWNEINRDYVEPAKDLASTASRYASAAVEVATESAGGITPPDLKGISPPKVNLDVGSVIGSVNPTGDVKQQAISTLSGLLDAAGDAREAEAKAEKPKASTQMAPGLVSSTNAALLTAIPGLGLLFVGVFVPSKLLGIDLGLPF